MFELLAVMPSLSFSLKQRPDADGDLYPGPPTLRHAEVTYGIEHAMLIRRRTVCLVGVLASSCVHLVRVHMEGLISRLGHVLVVRSHEVY